MHNDDQILIFLRVRLNKVHFTEYFPQYAMLLSRDPSSMCSQSFKMGTLIGQAMQLQETPGRLDQSAALIQMTFASSRVSQITCV